MQEAGREVPALDNEPSELGYEWVIEAFWQLSTCRAMGMGPGPIPWTAVEAYARSAALDEHETWWLHNLVRHMDGVWLTCVSEEASRGSASRKQPAKNPGNRRPKGRQGR